MKLHYYLILVGITYTFFACEDEEAFVGNEVQGQVDQGMEQMIKNPVPDFGASELLGPDMDTAGQYGSLCESDADCISGYCIEVESDVCVRPYVVIMKIVQMD